MQSTANLVQSWSRLLESVFSPVSSKASVYELYLAPKIIRQALFWILSSFLDCFSVRQPCQTGVAYSTTGRTYEIYTETKSSTGSPNRFKRLSMYSRRLLLPTMLLTCMSQLKLDWTIKPRSLVSVTRSSSLPAILREGGLGGSLMKVTCITLHFEGLSFRW